MVHYAYFGQTLRNVISHPRRHSGRTSAEENTTLKPESRFDPEIVVTLGLPGHKDETVGAFNHTIGHAGALVHYPTGVIEGAAVPSSDRGVTGFRAMLPECPDVLHSRLTMELHARRDEWTGSPASTDWHPVLHAPGQFRVRGSRLHFSPDATYAGIRETAGRFRTSIFSEGYASPVRLTVSWKKLGHGHMHSHLPITRDSATNHISPTRLHDETEPRILPAAATAGMELFPGIVD